MKSIPSFLFRGVSEISKNKLAADQFLFQFTTLIYRDLFFYSSTENLFLFKKINSQLTL